MNRSLALSAIAAVLGLAACTSTPDTAAPSGTTTTTTPPPEVVTEVVTATVTNPPRAVAKTDNRLGYGALKLGMTLEEARAAGLTDLTWSGAGDQTCVADDAVAISRKHGVVRITLPAEARTSRGIGVGSTYAEVRGAYPDATEYDDGWSAEVAGNATYSFVGNPEFVFFGDTDEVFRIKLGAVEADCAPALL